MMKALELAPIVRLRGTDAIAFAQTQFSADVAALTAGRWQWNAWLDAQGRTRHFFALLRTSAEELLIWLPLGDSDAMRVELQRFVFRAKVIVERIEDWALHERIGDNAPAHGRLDISSNSYALALPGSPDRSAVLAPRAGQTFDATALDAWRYADIACGLPWIAAPLAGEYVPQALGLQRLEAVSLEKGCYPGQEIVARLHYRGGNKRALFRVQTPTRKTPLAGSDIVKRDKANAIGRVLYSASMPGYPGAHVALAVLPRDADPTQLLIAEVDGQDATTITAWERVGVTEA